MADKKNPVEVEMDTLRKLNMAEFLDEFKATMIRVNLGETTSQEPADLAHDYAVLRYVKNLVTEMTKRQDEDLMTVRKIRGADYAPGVDVHRKRKEKDNNPFAGLFAEAE